MLTPWKESCDQPRQHIKKQRHYFANKGPSSQGYGFSSGRVWMWELDYKESWGPRIDAFELWCWRRLLRFPWTARRSKQSILKEISPGCSLEGLMLKPKLQYFGHLTQGTDRFIWKKPWCWARLRAGGEGDNRVWEVGWHHLLDGHGFGWTPGVSDGQGGLACCSPWITKSQTWLSDWTIIYIFVSAHLFQVLKHYVSAYCF